MSIPDSHVNSDKHSSFRLFKRKKTKQTKLPTLLQLPDSAISARTMRGSRYIAISIPFEYDHPDIPQKLQQPLHQNPTKTFTKPQHQDAVIVPKPVVHQPTKLSPLEEVYEATSFRASEKMRDRKRDSRSSRANYSLISEDHRTILEPQSKKSKLICMIFIVLKAISR